MSTELESFSINDISLESKYQNVLRKANIRNVSELMTRASEELSKGMKISLSEVTAIKKAVCNGLSSKISLTDLPEDSGSKFTTGDDEIDEAVGGGIRTGSVWEIVGEGGSGKTQLSYQLALSIQLPLDLGGLAGSACFLFTRHLQTNRIIEIAQTHPLLSKANCGLSDIHTMMIRTPELLLHALSAGLPDLQRRLITQKQKPVKVVILDSISSLLYLDGESSNALKERSKQLMSISRLMHSFASNHNIAFIVINGVQDSFPHEREEQDLPPAVLSYKKQERWFGTSHLVAGSRKVARLGLIWANQPNVRLMLSKTSHRKHVESEPSPKRRRMSENAADIRTGDEQKADKSVVVRQLSVVFSSVGTRKFCEFSISTAGIKSLSQATESLIPGVGNFDDSIIDTIHLKPPIGGNFELDYGEDEEPGILDRDDHLWASFVQLSQQDFEELESSLASGPH